MPYESAHDLPSFVEISQGLKSIKLLKFFLPKAERGKIKELEAQLRLLGDTVDKFYAVLGPRHWIFHDNLPVEEIADLLTASSGPAEAERRLIDYLQDSRDSRLTNAQTAWAYRYAQAGTFSYQGAR